MNEHVISLDLSKEPTTVPVLYLGQGDRNGTTLVVNLYDNGQVLDLTGLSVKFCMRTPDMLEFYEVAGAVSGNVATFLIDETYAAGHVGKTDEAYVSVVDGEDSSSTSRISVVVLPSAKEGVDPAPAYKPLIDEFIEENQEAVDEIIEAAQEVLDDGIPLMSPTRRGGAKLGQGLKVDDGTLSLGNLVESGTGAEVTTHGSAIYGVTGQGYATQDGTPTPDNPVEIEVARGRNLVNVSDASGTMSSSYYKDINVGLEIDMDGVYCVSMDVTTSVTPYKVNVQFGPTASTSVVETGQTTFSSNGRVSVIASLTEAQKATIRAHGSYTGKVYITIVRAPRYASQTTFTYSVKDVQIELGSTPSPYVPYGCVGLDVASAPALYKSGHAITARGEESANSSFKILRALACGTGGMVDAASVSAGSMTRVHAYDAHGNWISQLATKDGAGTVTFAIPSTAYELRFSTPNSAALELTCTTAVPLPTKGWAGAAGTYKDALEVDSAGGYAWTVKTAIIASYNGDTVSAPYMSTTGGLDTGATVLYHPSSNTTESGYISDWPSEIPEGAVISCPELHSIGVSVFVPGAREIAQHVSNVYKRIEAAIAEVATS